MSGAFDNQSVDSNNEVPGEEAEVGETTSVTDISDSDRQMALLCHLSPLLVGFLGPLIFWLVKKDESPFMDHHGREAVNFHLTIMIAGLVCGALACLVIGFILLPLVGIASIVYSILAGVAANRGEWYRFPYTIRMIK